jgi:hypothetical protein
MQNLSHLAASSLSVSSMSGGNRTSDNIEAQTAAGSQPVDPEIAKIDQGDPTIQIPDVNNDDRHLVDSGESDLASLWTSSDDTKVWPQ